jgi:hypothetical protein
MKNKKHIKSRRDDILLTVGFNLRRTSDLAYSPQSPAGTTQWIDKVSSLRDLLSALPFYFRKLKLTVNQVLSLRDLQVNKLASLKKIINKYKKSNETQYYYHQFSGVNVYHPDGRTCPE